jgi:hypothetical protein
VGRFPTGTMLSTMLSRMLRMTTMMIVSVVGETRH